MALDPLVGLVTEGWDELDRVLDGLDAADATRQVDGGSSFAWTLGHVTNQLDSWVNVRLQHVAPHPVLEDARWRAAHRCLAGQGGTPTPRRSSLHRARRRP